MDCIVRGQALLGCCGRQRSIPEGSGKYCRKCSASKKNILKNFSPKALSGINQAGADEKRGVDLMLFKDGQCIANIVNIPIIKSDGEGMGNRLSRSNFLKESSKRDNAIPCLKASQMGVKMLRRNSQKLIVNFWLPDLMIQQNFWLHVQNISLHRLRVVCYKTGRRFRPCQYSHT